MGGPAVNGFEKEEDGASDDEVTTPGTAIQEMLKRLDEDFSVDWGDITQEMEIEVPPPMFGTILPPPLPATPDSPNDLTVDEEEEGGPRTERNPVTGTCLADWPEA